MRIHTPGSLLALLILASPKIWAQDSTAESLRAQLHDEYKKAYQNQRIQELRKQFEDLRSKSLDYLASTITSEISTADISSFNNDLIAAGLPTMRNTFTAIGAGYSRMKKRVTGDLWASIIIANESKNNNYTVRLYGANVSFTKGYAIINTRAFKAYPFLGIGMHDYIIRVTKKNSSFPVNTVTDIGQGNQQSELYRNIFYATGGAQIDYNIPFNQVSGVQLGFRYAYNLPLAKGKYKVADGNPAYKPDINWRQNTFMFVVSFFTREIFTRNRRE